jgi:hypothetical protein
VANISMRGSVTPGRPLIAGFVVPGAAGAPTTQSRDLLVRVVGPGLTQFGVAGAWADPDFSVQGLGVANTFSTEAHAADWSANSDATATLEKISAFVGAFPLNRGSRDAVSVLRVIPGSYTIVASPAAGDPGGEALIEVYVLP